jgi:hypothetical protein
MQANTARQGRTRMALFYGGHAQENAIKNILKQYVASYQRHHKSKGWSSACLLGQDNRP